MRLGQNLQVVVNKACICFVEFVTCWLYSKLAKPPEHRPPLIETKNVLKDSKYTDLITTFFDIESRFEHKNFENKPFRF